MRSRLYAVLTVYCVLVVALRDEVKFKSQCGELVESFEALGGAGQLVESKVWTIVQDKPILN